MMCAGQGTYILCSKGLQAQYSSSKQYTTHHRAASIRIEKNKKWCCNIFMCVLTEGKGVCWAKKKRRVKNMLRVMTVLVRRQLVWGPDVALGQVGRMFRQFLIFQGCSAFQQVLICRPPCTYQFLILISSSSSAQMLTCKFLNSSKSQSEILNYQILDNCRVLYTPIKAIKS